MGDAKIQLDPRTYRASKIAWDVPSATRIVEQLPSIGEKGLVTGRRSRSGEGFGIPLGSLAQW